MNEKYTIVSIELCNADNKKMRLHDLCLAISEINKIDDINHVKFCYTGEPGLNSNIIVGCKILKNEGYLIYLDTGVKYLKYIKHAVPYLDSLAIYHESKNMSDYWQTVVAVRQLLKMCDGYNVKVFWGGDPYLSVTDLCINVNLDVLMDNTIIGNLRDESLRNILEKINVNEKDVNIDDSTL